MAALDGPDFPVALNYLHGWLLELFGRSGVDMKSGITPLGYGTIAEWARLTDRHPAPHEVMALLELDAILRNPETGEEG